MNTGTPNHTDHDDTTPDANTALRGAFLAFQKKTTKPTADQPSAPVSTSTATRDIGHGQSNGALIAATSASRDHSLSRSPSHLAAGQGTLLGVAKSATGNPRSPSLIAATVAASRNTSPSPKPLPPPLPAIHTHTHTKPRPAARERRKAKANAGDANAVDSASSELNLTTDSSPIPPTNALISLFEQNRDATDPVKKSPAVAGVKKGPRTGLRPMTPPRVMSPVISPVVAYDTSPSMLASTFAWEKTLSMSPSTGRDGSRARTPLSDARDIRSLESTPVPRAARKQRPVTPPPKAISRASTVILAPRPRQASSHKIVVDPPDTVPSSAGTRTEAATQRQARALGTSVPLDPSLVPEKASSAVIRRSSSSLSNDTFVSASSAPSPQPASPIRQSPRHQTPEALRPSQPSRHIVSSPPHSHRPAQRSQTNLPLESLTNAIVAGSLASARATPSTAKPPTPPPPRKQTPHMRQTLRAPRTQSEEELTGIRPQHKTKPLGKLSSRKKHAHHEGARKRWREEITARERQRYEGVWASNRGLLLHSPNTASNGSQSVDTSQLVANVIVRDIWGRSRLPFDELAEVWDLVDMHKKGALDKAEFVVGMWLIDQRLRGRKIPRKVSDSVWGSAKGVRVLGPKAKK